MTDRIFKFGQDFINTVDQAEYTDGSGVQADISATPTVEIHNWENIKLVDRNLINSKAGTTGWIDVTPIV